MNNGDSQGTEKNNMTAPCSSSLSSDLDREGKVKVEIMSGDGFVVVGAKYRGRNEHGEIPALWGQFMPRLGEIDGKADEGVFYGVMGNYDTATGEFDYVAGAEVLPDTAVPPGMARWEVPPGTYAVVTFPFSKLMEAIDYINRTWLPQSGRLRAVGPEYEYYGLAFEPDDPNTEMQYYVPVTNVGG